MRHRRALELTSRGAGGTAGIFLAALALASTVSATDIPDDIEASLTARTTLTYNKFALDTVDDASFTTPPVPSCDTGCMLVTGTETGNFPALVATVQRADGTPIASVKSIELLGKVSGLGTSRVVYHNQKNLLEHGIAMACLAVDPTSLLQVHVGGGKLTECARATYAPFAHSDRKGHAIVDAPYFSGLAKPTGKGAADDRCGKIAERRLVVRPSCVRLIVSGVAAVIGSYLREQKHPHQRRATIYPDPCTSDPCRVMGIVHSDHATARAMLPATATLADQQLLWDFDYRVVAIRPGEPGGAPSGAAAGGGAASRPTGAHNMVGIDPSAWYGMGYSRQTKIIDNFVKYGLSMAPCDDSNLGAPVIGSPAARHPTSPLNSLASHRLTSPPSRHRALSPSRPLAPPSRAHPVALRDVVCRSQPPPASPSTRAARATTSCTSSTEV